MIAIREAAVCVGRSVPNLRALLQAILLILSLTIPREALAQDGFTPSRFSVEVTGEGPDVILIPGLSTTREVWRGHAEALAGRYRLHLVQIRGFGEDAGPNAQGRVLEPLVEELARYIADNGIEKPAVAGHSLGGLIALMLGADHPALPGRLMIVDALPWYGVIAARPGAEVTPGTIEPQARAVRDALLASFGQPPPEGAGDAAIASQVLDQSKVPLVRGWTAGADSRVTGQLVYEDLLTDMRERIARITAPLTMVYPWNETYPTRAQADAFYRQQYAALPGASFVDVGPAAHFLMADQPDAFQAALETFLAR